MYKTVEPYSKVGFRVKTPRINLAYAIIVVCSIIIFARGISVFENMDVKRYLYTETLNRSIPILETTMAGKADAIESTISFKGFIIKLFGLDQITPFTIVGNEVSLFDDCSKLNTSESVASNQNPFNIDENCITRSNNEVFDPSLKKDLDATKPEILIYHTHSSEGYDNTTDTPNNDANVIAAGKELKKELERYGFAVIHDTTSHSIPSYDESYNRSRETLEKNLKKYGTFDLVIDLHRDSASNKDTVTTNINEENLAKIMTVSAKNSNRYSKHKELVDGIYEIGESKFPGLLRPKLEYEVGRNAFNQDLCDNSVLIECGSYVNTVEEAKASTKYIANIFAEYFNGNE